MIYAGYVKVALGKPQTGCVKLKISPGTEEAKFSLGEGEKIHWVGFQWVCYRGVFSWGEGKRQNWEKRSLTSDTLPLLMDL